MHLIKSIAFSLMAMSFQLAHATPLNAQQALTEAPPLSLFESWNTPIEPFKIFNHIYYVGTENLSSVLFDTGDGLVLIDSGIAQSAPQIKANIQHGKGHDEAAARSKKPDEQREENRPEKVVLFLNGKRPGMSEPVRSLDAKGAGPV